MIMRTRLIGKQYWWDNVYDPAFDMSGAQGAEIRMIDGHDRVERLVIRREMSVDEISTLWKRIKDIPTTIPVRVLKHSEENYYWGIGSESMNTELACTVITNSNRGNSQIYDGSNTFIGEQVSRVLGIKLPPLERCQVDRTAKRLIIRTD